MLYFNDLRAVRENLTSEQLGRLLCAIMDYAELYTVPDFGSDPLLKFAWDTLRQSLDRDAEAYRQKREKNRDNARKRWYKETMPSDATASDRIKPDAMDANTNTNTSTSTNTKEKEADKPPARSRFSPPSVEDVEAYVREKGYHIDPEAFVAFYESKGWKVGNAPMKDWRAAVVTWVKREQGTDLRANRETQVAVEDWSKRYHNGGGNEPC